jgi:phage/plasmid-like protein (TIGR03299 family)
MPAYFENGVFTGNKPAWHGLGVVVPDETLTAADVCRHVPELAMRVTKEPLYVDFDGRRLPVPRKIAVVREDGRVLGAGLTETYRPIQNEEAFAFLDEIVASGEAKYETAGTLREGAVAWMLARLPRDILVGGIESERVEQRLLCVNSFDGSLSLTAKLVRTRVVCANTLDVALGESGREIRIRHTKGLDGRIEEARRVLQIAFRSSEAFERTANWLLSRRMSDAEFERFLDRLIPLPVDADPDKDRAARNRQEAREAILAFFRHGENLANVRNTRWAAYNAVAEWFDHAVPSRRTRVSAEENRMRRVLFDFALKDRALKQLLAA